MARFHFQILTKNGKVIAKDWFDAVDEADACDATLSALMTFTCRQSLPPEHIDIALFDEDEQKLADMTMTFSIRINEVVERIH
jgi:hypothetical protein